MNPAAAVAVRVASKLVPGTSSGRALILIYHRVHREVDPMFPLDLTADQFDWQMAQLRQCFNPMPLVDAVTALKADCLPPRTVCITFDDGYLDNEEVALPILQRYDIPATFFISTLFLDGDIMWNDAVVESLRRSDLEQVDLGQSGVVRREGGDTLQKGIFAEEVIRRIKHLPPAARAAAVESVVDQTGATLPRQLMMTASGVRRLHRSGMEIGAHTVTHPILRTLGTEEATREIRDSRDTLEGIIGTGVRSFAYPNGRLGDDYEQRERDLVEKMGFSCAVTTNWGAATSRSDQFQLPRFNPWDKNPVKWIARVMHQFGHAA